MRPLSLFASVFLPMVLIVVASAQASPALAGSFATPQRGSPQRAAIMNALRGPVQKVLGQKIVFVVHTLNVGNGWAFLFSTPKQASGESVDYSKTKYAQAIEDGMFDDTISALLRNNGSGWKVLTYEIGATDVPWGAWPQDFGAPRALFAR